MPRQIRIEYEGARYHVMARGDRREPIVHDDTDRQGFLDLWEQAVERTGWKVLALVLMRNHYHAVIETPEANLVDGMKWVQNTWTRRFNSKHGLWGHLYGGRYKSILCDEGTYLQRLINYVHLNPVRAGIITSDEKLESYKWGSLIDYIRPGRSRRPWIAVGSGLEVFEYEDKARDRRRYLEKLQGQIDWQQPRRAGVGTIEGQSMHSTLKRGWYFGTETFREEIAERLKTVRSAVPGKFKPHSGYTADDTRDHGIREADQLLATGLKYYGLSREDLETLPKGDGRKVAIATLIRNKTTVSLAWISQNLFMGHIARISGLVNRARKGKAYQKIEKKILKRHGTKK